MDWVVLFSTFPSFPSDFPLIPFYFYHTLISFISFILLYSPSFNPNRDFPPPISPLFLPNFHPISHLSLLIPRCLTSPPISFTISPYLTAPINLPLIPYLIPPPFSYLHFFHLFLPGFEPTTSRFQAMTLPLHYTVYQIFF